jgi:hypothetical protein
MYLKAINSFLKKIKKGSRNKLLKYANIKVFSKFTFIKIAIFSTV